MVQAKICKCCLCITDHLYIGPNIIVPGRSPQRNEIAIQAASIVFKVLPVYRHGTFGIRKIHVVCITIANRPRIGRRHIYLKAVAGDYA